jgi:hypothetical protein
MRTHPLPRILVAALAVTALAVAATTSGAAPDAQTAATKRITRKGVDGVKLHATYKHLRKIHKVRRIGPGCELASDTRSAKLRKPLKGVVNFKPHKHPRRVSDITVRGGATARGVGVGDTIPDIKAKYPHAKVDHSTDSTLGASLVRVPKRDGGRIMFAVDTGTHKITSIGVPIIAICD